MEDTYFRREGKQIYGTNGSSGYDEGNRLIINGKTYYKEGNNRYFCPDDGKIYFIADGHISTAEDGIIGTYDNLGARIDGKPNAQKHTDIPVNNSKKRNIDNNTALGSYYLGRSLWKFVKSHIIALIIFYYIFGVTFVATGRVLGNPYLGFFIGLILAIAISGGIEKIIKSFYELIKRGNFKGKPFLIIGIFTLLFGIASAYAFYGENNTIETYKQRMEEDSSYSSYATVVIKNAENNKDMALISCISSTAIAIVCGTIFIIKNRNTKHL